MSTTDPALKPNTGAGEARVTGFVPPIITPMQDGRLDNASLFRQLDYLVDHVAGYLVGGSLGEVASLTIEERESLMRACAEHAQGERALAVSISDNCLETSRRLAGVAGEINATLVVASCPNYYSNDLDMLIAYFGALADFAPVDICLYDNPIASNTQLTVENIKAIHEAVPRVSHVKITDTAVEKVGALKGATNLVIYSGDDSVLWHQLTRGAEGAMVALPMIYPEKMSSLWQAIQDGERATAFEIYGQTTRFLQLALGALDYVVAVKTVLHDRGVIASPDVRLPLLPPSELRRSEFLAAL